MPNIELFKTTPFPLLGLFLILTFSSLQAGSVISLKDNSETTGKTTLVAGSVHVDGMSASHSMDAGDVLEADFSDSPFHLNYFSSRVSPNQLPPSWKGQDIGNPPTPGSSNYANGVLTVNGTRLTFQRPEKEDSSFFIGQSWTGNGQFIARIKEINPPDSPTLAGPMIRDNTGPLDVMQAFGIGTGGGLSYGRYSTGDHVSWTGFPVDIPSWMRFSWSGKSLEFAVATDGKNWKVLNQTEVKTVADHWIGIFVNREDKTPGTAVFDHLTFTPPVAESETLPAGVLLTSGSFLAGGVQYLNPNDGAMLHNEKTFPLHFNQVATIIAHPLNVHELQKISSKQGVMMKDGDFLEADIQGIQGTYVEVNSIILGPMSYYGDLLRACSLHPIAPVPSNYEIRLKDGSMIRAKGFNITNGQIVIDEVSGVAITVNPDEIAQFRAGSAQVQNLMELPWKAQPASATPPTDTSDTPPAAVETWEGPNQEQMIVATANNTIDFPLDDKFRALSLHIALSPDSVPNGQASLRILADGVEVKRTPPLKSGDTPFLVNVPLQNPKTLTFAIDSSVPGARLLIIDPVALRTTKSGK